jgi:hypothetical protein
MANRRIAFNLPADLVRKAKFMRSNGPDVERRGSGTAGGGAVAPRTGETAAGKRILSLADKGPYSRIDPGSIKREELYERR